MSLGQSGHWTTVPWTNVSTPREQFKSVEKAGEQTVMYPDYSYDKQAGAAPLYVQRDGKWVCITWPLVEIKFCDCLTLLNKISPTEIRCIYGLVSVE